MTDGISLTTSTLGQRIKALRAGQQLSLRQLAERAGVTASYISAIERGKLSPTIALLGKLLAALQTDLASFFTTDITANEQIAFRQATMQRVDDGGRRYTFLFPRRGDIRMEVLDEVLLPDETPEFEQMAVDLAGYVLSGTLQLEIAGSGMETVRSGDAFYVPAGHPVRGSCAGETPVHLITVMTPPRY